MNILLFKLLLLKLFFYLQDGEVVGINCITVQAASGISFAIPSDTASEFLKGAKERAKKLKDSPGLMPPKRRTIDRFYIGREWSFSVIDGASSTEMRQCQIIS